MYCISPSCSVAYEGTTNGTAANRQLRLRGRRAAAAFPCGRQLRGHVLCALDRRGDFGPARRRGAEAREDEAEEQEQDREQRHAWMLRRGQHPVEHRERAGLVEWLVQVAALRALHAGRTTPLAGAGAQQLRGVLGPALED